MNACPIKAWTSSYLVSSRSVFCFINVIQIFVLLNICFASVRDVLSRFITRDPRLAEAFQNH